MQAEGKTWMGAMLCLILDGAARSLRGRALHLLRVKGGLSFRVKPVNDLRMLCSDDELPPCALRVFAPTWFRSKPAGFPKISVGSREPCRTGAFFALLHDAQRCKLWP